MKWGTGSSKSTRNVKSQKKRPKRAEPLRPKTATKGQVHEILRLSGVEVESSWLTKEEASAALHTLKCGDNAIIRTPDGVAVELNLRGGVGDATAGQLTYIESITGVALPPGSLSKRDARTAIRHLNARQEAPVSLKDGQDVVLRRKT